MGIRGGFSVLQPRALTCILLTLFGDRQSWEAFTDSSPASAPSLTSFPGAFYYSAGLTPPLDSEAPPEARAIPYSSLYPQGLPRW